MTTSTPGISHGTPTSVPIVPIAENERIVFLDSLRGIALLGILLMNIPGFALPYEQVFDPSIKNELSGINFYTYYSTEWLLEGTQRALFSMLFGAGMLLFIGRLEKKTDGIMVAEYYFRRQLWLLLFGLFNAYVLLWFWDILYHYAILGMLLFPFRRLSPKLLFVLAGICLVMMTVRENVDFLREKRLITKGEAIAAIDTTVTKLSPKDKEALREMVKVKEGSSLTSRAERVEKNTQQVLGSYGDLYDVHGDRSFDGQTAGLFHFLFWDILVCMFLGMAFYKTGIITGVHPTWIYWWLFIVGLGVGLPLSYLRLQPMIEYQYNEFEIVKNGSFAFYELSRAFRSLGIFGLVVLLYKSGWFKWLFAMTRPVGRMAFTNYLLQSFLCGVVFYGVGFGLFGKLQRFEIYYVLAAVWIFQIIFSHVWFRYFKFGPMEWFWRSLTYWQMPVMRRAAR